MAAATARADGGGAHEGAAPRLTLVGSLTSVRRADASSIALARLDAALLAVLALEGATSRQRLLQLLWPDDEPESARNALRQRLFRLRHTIGAEVIAGGSEVLMLSPGTTHDVDADSDGVLLAAHDYAGSPVFEDWLHAQRVMLASRCRERRFARIDACEREGGHAEGALLAERLVAADALDEAAVQRLMKLRYLAGQPAAAVAVFERFAAALRDDCTGLPARATTDLLATIRAAREPLLPIARREMPVSVLRPPRFIGRDRELERMHAARSAGRAFWLLGEAGMGKTRIIGEFVADAGRVSPAGSATVVVPARPGDAGVPYATLGRALRQLVERREPHIEQSQRSELARVVPEMGPAEPRQVHIGQHLMLQRAIETLLRDAQGGGLAALVIDDLHFADSASLEMLQGLVLADSLGDLHWGFAQRPADGLAAAESLRAALEEAQRVESITLNPLDEQQLVELVESLSLDGIDAPRLAPLLVKHTGGNPMYALETIKHLLANDMADAADAALPRPPSVGQLIERRLRQLSAQALALARVAAIAGVDFAIELAETVLGQPALALADAWRELEAAQVLRGQAFAHDLVYEATLASVPEPIAARTHGAVAAVLQERGGEPARVAAHWIAAGQASRALAALHAAAAAAQRAMRRKEEAAFLAQAADIEAAAGDRVAEFASRRAMIEALWAADRRALDAASFDRLQASATSDRERGAALVLRANWSYEAGDADDSMRLCRSAIELAERAGDENTAAQARQRLAEILHFRGDFDGAVALLQQLMPWFAANADDLQRVNFHGDFAIALDNANRSREARVHHQLALDLARRIGAWSDAVIILSNLAVSWAGAGFMVRAIGYLREALQLAAAHDEARGCAASLPIEMHNNLRDSGHYADALRWVEPALAAAEGQLAAWLPLVRCHIACGWIHLGQHARAQREVDAALKTAGPEWMRAKALQMRARIRLALGKGARELLEEARAAVPRDGRRMLRLSITLDHTLTMEPKAAWAAARDVIAEAERIELTGTALAGHIRAARFAVDAGLAAEALAHARVISAIGEEVMPLDLFPAERWLNAWRAFRLAGHEAEAAAALRCGVAWVHETSREHVPEPFRDSFARANTINQQLLRASP